MADTPNESGEELAAPPKAKSRTKAGAGPGAQNAERTAKGRRSKVRAPAADLSTPGDPSAEAAIPEAPAVKSRATGKRAASKISDQAAGAAVEGKAPAARGRKPKAQGTKPEKAAPAASAGKTKSTDKTAAAKPARARNPNGSSKASATSNGATAPEASAVSRLSIPAVSAKQVAAGAGLFAALAAGIAAVFGFRTRGKTDKKEQ